MLRASALRAHWRDWPYSYTGPGRSVSTLRCATAGGNTQSGLHRTTPRGKSSGHIGPRRMGSRSCDHPVFLSMQPTRGFPNNIHPGGLYRLTACTHQCTPSSRQHTATQSHRHVSRQAGPPRRTCHVHASTWTNLPERLSAVHARALTGLRPLRETHRRFQNVPRRRPLMSKTYLRFGPMPAKAIS